jgi:hypothetical protein
MCPGRGTFQRRRLSPPSVSAARAAARGGHPRGDREGSQRPPGPRATRGSAFLRPKPRGQGPWPQLTDRGDPEGGGGRRPLAGAARRQGGKGGGQWTPPPGGKTRRPRRGGQRPPYEVHEDPRTKQPSTTQAQATVTPDHCRSFCSLRSWFRCMPCWLRGVVALRSDACCFVVCVACFFAPSVALALCERSVRWLCCALTLS